ncbi:MAG: hypothetical protein M3O25_03215 [Actinomycetota bacterium]|nr:hypothetical protein [Actinomycetota bacterium]
MTRARRCAWLAAAVLGLALTPAAAEAAVTTSFADGTLTVTGDAADDRVALRLSDGALQVDVGDDGIPDFEVTATEVQDISVSAGDGNDDVRLDESGGGLRQFDTFFDGGGGNDVLTGGRGRQVLLGGDGADTLNGLRGDDVSFAGGGDDVMVWSAGDGNDVLEGQDGRDVAAVSGTGAAEGYDIVPNGGRIRVLRELDGSELDGNDIEQIELDARRGADSIAVDELDGTGLEHLQLDLGGQLGTRAPDGSADRVTVAGAGGADRLALTGGSGLADLDGLEHTLGLSRVETLDAVTVQGGSGRDVLDAASFTGAQLTLEGGANNDVLLGGPQDDVIDGGRGDDVAFLGAGDDRALARAGDGDDTIDGQEGTDVVVADGDTSDEELLLTARGGRAQLLRASTPAIDTHSVERLELAAGDGADSLTLNDLSGTDLAEVQADLGSGADDASIRGTNRADSIDVSGDSNSVRVDGLATVLTLTDPEPSDALEIRTAPGADIVDTSGLAPGTLSVIIT